MYKLTPNITAIDQTLIVAAVETLDQIADSQRSIEILLTQKKLYFVKEYAGKKFDLTVTTSTLGIFRIINITGKPGRKTATPRTIILWPRQVSVETITEDTLIDLKVGKEAYEKLCRALNAEELRRQCRQSLHAQPVVSKRTVDLLTRFTNYSEKEGEIQ